MERLTIREAAWRLGITPQALRSRAKYRGIALEKAPGPHGDRYLVNVADLPVLSDETVLRNGSVDPTGPSRKTVPHETVPSDANETVPLPAHLEVLAMLGETQRRLQEAQEQRHLSQEEVRLLERQTMALQWELTGYRRALAENAESLAEKAAIALQGEHQVQAVQLRADLAESERAALAEQNARQREEFEREQATLTESLRQAQERVRWLEQRVPSWIRRLLGAG